MFVKNKKITSVVKVLMMVMGLIIILLSTGCLIPSTDEIQIKRIAKNIEKAIEKKDVDLFMQNISYDYSDPNGGTYDNHINGLPEDIISQMELAEDLANSVSGWLNIVTDVNVSGLTVFEQYASGKIEIKFSLKVCLGAICAGIPGVDANESIEYNVDFQKEGDDWKIISMVEK